MQVVSKVSLYTVWHKLEECKTRFWRAKQAQFDFLARFTYDITVCGSARNTEKIPH